MKKLIQAEPKNRDNLGIEFVERPLRKMYGQMIQAALPAESARDDVRGKRAVPFVFQVLPAAGQRRRQIRAAVLDRAQGVERRDPRRRSHPVVKRTPTA